MTYSTPDMIISGVPYEVVEVGGRSPGDLHDLVDDATFVLEGPTGRHEVTGEGSRVEGGVRFHQKAPPDGKDVRVWLVRATDGGLLAETCD